MKNHLYKSLLFTLGLLLIVTATAFAQSVVTQGELTGTPTELCEAVTPAAEPETRTYEQAEQVLEAGIDYRAVFCTEAGPVYVDLYEEFAPITVNSFVFLAERGYYNNTTFHRVLADFMAQGGDPTGTGAGGPGYEFINEPVGFLHFDVPGLLAMANAGPDTNGSQFFITTVAYPSLNYGYTLFGEVLEGQENVEGIRLRDPQADTEPGTLLNTVLIITNPEGVTSTYEPLPLATQDDMLEVFANLPDIGIPLEEAGTGIVERDALVGSFSEDVTEDLTTFLDAHSYEYSARVTHANADCDLQNVPLMRLSYTLHTFANKEAASAALADEFITTFVTGGEEYEATEGEILPNTLYTRETTACDTDAIQARTYWQRGRFITVGEVVIPTNSEGTPEQWLSQVVGQQLYENLLSSILRPEIRSSVNE